MFLKASDVTVINDSKDDQNRTSTRSCSKQRETNKKTAGVFLDTLSALAYKTTKKTGEFVLPGFGKLVEQKRKARTGLIPSHNRRSGFCQNRAQIPSR
jgi:hypothetical protein